METYSISNSDHVDLSRINNATKRFEEYLSLPTTYTPPEEKLGDVFFPQQALTKVPLECNEEIAEEQTFSFIRENKFDLKPDEVRAKGLSLKKTTFEKDLIEIAKFVSTHIR